MSKKFNFTEGPLLKNIIIYALPIIASNILQLLFNTADTIVVGQFAANKSALPAVGATTSLVYLIVGLAIGISSGANIVLSKCVGEKDPKKAKNVVGTAIFIGFFLGIALACVGVGGARTFLTWMDCPDSVIDLSTLYVRIYCLGLPIVFVYNFSSSILRASGDTIRPLLYLIMAGIINVCLNMFFVMVFGMDVDGVAIATITSQLIAGIGLLRILLKDKDFARLEPKYLKPDKNIAAEIFRIGIPAGIQSSLFSLSNVFVQASVNSFGNEILLSGNTISNSLEGFLYNGMNGVSLATLTVIGQNYGALNFERIKKSIFRCVLVVISVGITLSTFVLLFHEPLCALYRNDPEVIAYAYQRLSIVGTSYFLGGTMEVLSNCLRGLGKSVTSMIISLSGSCLFRIIWLLTIFKAYPTLEMIYIVYPISWIITPILHTIFLIATYKKLKNTYMNKYITA